jgi:hypothetical protein
MIGLLAVLLYIALNVALLALDGRRRYGSFAGWWRS